MPRQQSRRDRSSQRRRLSMQSLEDRRLLAVDLGLPTGALRDDTAEFLLGRVAVTPVFLESDGSIDTETENWSTQEIDEILAKITVGVNWWTEALDQLDTVHSLEFVIDDTYARTPVEIGYEPINRPSDDYDRYASDFLDFAGIDPSLRIADGIQQFNHDQRQALDTDWAFTIFVADSSVDADGFFPDTGSHRGAFAFAGNGFFVTTSSRPASTIAHEMGHIFWAFDEYAGGGTFHASRGYYETQNTNAFDNPEPGFAQEDSIMADFNRLFSSYESHESAESTLALVGWQDSDGDGIFDVLDVPLSLKGSGLFDEATGQYRLVAEASVETLANRNTSGPQSDITINRISDLQVSVDGGNWTTVASPNSPTASFDLSIDVPVSFDTIQFRVIDAGIGLVSPRLSGTRFTPLVNPSSLIGFSYIDNNRDGARGAGEPLLENTTIEVTQVSGDPLPNGSLNAATLPLNSDISTLAGITLSGNTMATENALQAREYSPLSDQPLFHVYDRQLEFWTAVLNERVGFDAVFDQPTGNVEVDVVAVGGLTSVARIEGFDAAGNLIARATTDIRNHPNAELASGESQTLTLQDPMNQIVRVEASGHAGTSIAVAGIRYGQHATISTDVTGAFSVANLPDGQYQINATPQDVDFEIATTTVMVSSGELVGGAMELSARPKFSPRHNQADPEDVNNNNSITATDALQIINDLNTNGSRALAWDDFEGSKIDVTNDGVVTALDALRVINRLNAEDGTNEPPAGEPIVGMQDDDDEFIIANPTASPNVDEVFTQPIKWVGQSGNDSDDGLQFV